jgi:leucyl aminopeptidase
MPFPFETAPNTSAIPITFATKTTWDAIAKELPEHARQFASANDFSAKPGKCLTLPAPDGRIAQVLFGLEDESSKSRDLFRPGALPGLLPSGVYRFANAPHDLRLATLAFALGSYRFGRYRKAEASDVRLVPPEGVDVADIARMAEAAALARDLINTPSNDMGPDLPPFYTHDETLADSVAAHAKRENDPLWRMPLWPPYDSWLDSKVADINNAPSGGFAGSITCALFLQRFVTDAKSWLHVDIYGWTPSAKPARPEGGECQAARAIYKLLSERYG